MIKVERIVIGDKPTHFPECRGISNSILSHQMPVTHPEVIQLPPLDTLTLCLLVDQVASTDKVLLKGNHSTC